MSGSNLVVITVLSASYPDHTRHGVPGAVTLSPFEQLEIPHFPAMELHNDPIVLWFLDDGRWIIHCGPSLQCKYLQSFDHGFAFILDPKDSSPTPLILPGIFCAIFIYNVIIVPHSVTDTESD